MKKFRSTLLFLLAVSLVLSLASCVVVEDSGETSAEDTTEIPAREYTAEELLTAIDEKMDSYDSYEAAVEMLISTTTNGINVKTTTTGIEIVRGLKTDNWECFAEVETVVSSPALTSSQKVTSVEAYIGGNYFISNRGTVIDKVDQKFYSPMSVEDAKALYEESEVDLFDFVECINKEIKTNEDGTYELTLSGYTANAINKIVEEVELDLDAISHTAIDLVFVIKADADLNATDMELSVVYDKNSASGAVPEISIKMRFSKYDEAEIGASAPNPEKYTLVDDVRILDDVNDLMDALKAMESGSFTLDITQTLKFMGDTQQSVETDNVTFGTNDKGYFYDIDADMDGTKYDISYSQGIQTVAVSGESHQVSQSEDEARAFVESLINSAQYNSLFITQIEKLSDNKYSFTCSPKSTYQPFIEQMGATFRSVTQKIVVTIENGAITAIDSEVNATGAITSGNSTYQLTFTVVSDVIFDK